MLVKPSGDRGPQLLTIEAWTRGHGVDVVGLRTTGEPSGDVPRCRLMVAWAATGPYCGPSSPFEVRDGRIAEFTTFDATLSDAFGLAPGL